MAGLFKRISRKINGQGAQAKKSIRPCFGLMRLENPSTFTECLALMARSVDYRLIYFRPKDVDVKTGKVNGQFYNGWKWKPVCVDIPRIVDVTPEVLAHAAQYEGVVELLKQRAYLTDDGGHVTTYDLQQALAADKHFAPYAMRTVKLESAQDLLDMLDTCDEAVVKPNVPGTGAVYLMRKLENGSFQVGVDQTWETLDAEAFQKRIEDALLKHAYVVQEYIASPSKLGDPFVCHVHAEKDGRNGWHVVRKYVRVGIGQCVSSNYADGGRSGYEPFIKACRPD